MIGVYGPTDSKDRTAANLPNFDYSSEDVAWLSGEKTFRYDPLPDDWQANEDEFNRLVGRGS